MVESIESTNFFGKWSKKYRPSTKYLMKIELLKRLRHELEGEIIRWDEIHDNLERIKSERKVEKTYSDPHEAAMARHFGPYYDDEEGDIPRLQKDLEDQKDFLTSDTKFLYRKVIETRLLDYALSEKLFRVRGSYMMVEWKRLVVSEIDRRIDDLYVSYKFGLESEHSDIWIIFSHFGNKLLSLLRWILKHFIWKIWSEFKSLNSWIQALIIFSILSAFGMVKFQDTIQTLMERV